MRVLKKAWTILMIGGIIFGISDFFTDLYLIPFAALSIGAAGILGVITDYVTKK